MGYRIKTVHKGLVLVCSIFISLFSASAFEIKAQQAVSAESSEIKIADLERAYDAQVYSVLSNYFDRKTFFVDAAVDAEVVEESYQSTQNRINSSRSRNIMMPGLPFLPDENLREIETKDAPETVVSENKIRSLKLNSVQLNIYADTSYNEMDLEFMRFIAGMAAKIDENRGDAIRINSIPIPEVSNASSSNAPQITVVNQPPAQAQGWLENLMQLIPGLVLMLLLGLTILVSRYSKKSKDEAVSPRSFRESVKAMDVEPFPVATSANKEHQKSRQTADLSSLSDHDKLVHAFFERPKQIAGVFEYWIENESWEGAVKAAEVVACVDPHLKRLIKKDLQPQHFKMLEEMMAELGSISLEKKRKVIGGFNELLDSDGSRSLNSKRKGNLTLFKFLDHIPEDIIIILLKNEEATNAALILNHLDDDKAADMLDKLGKERSAKVILELTSLDKLSSKEASEIASGVFANAMDLVEKRKEQRNKVESILPILEKLPVDTQRDYINELKEKEPYVGARIEEEFTTIDEIPQINKKVLEEGLKDIKTETLINALVQADEKIKSAVLQVRPKREQRLIRMELKELSSSEANSNGTAKALMMNSIRSAVKAYKTTSN